MPRRVLVLVAAVVVVAVAPGRAAAHDLKAVVKLLPDAVVVEAGFDGIPAQGARVVITDSAGKEVASGKTDEKGVCKLPKLSAGKYKATVESAGHRDEVEFPVAAAGLLDSPVEFARERPNQTIGLAIGVVGLLAGAAAFWWLRLRRSGAH